MKMYNNWLLFFFVTLTLTTFGQSTLTFDSLTANGFATPLAIPNGYGGFDWNNIYVVNTTGFPPSGFVNGTVSANNVAVGAYLTPTSFSSSAPFILVSGDFTSAHQNGMTFEVTGLNGASTVFDQTFILNLTGPSFLTFPTSPVTQVNFAASGGVDVMGYLGGGPEMVLDNLTIASVPEPSSALLFAAGLGALAWLRQRRTS